MGLWLLQESVRTWSARGMTADLDTLLAAAARAPALRAVIDPDDPEFLTPGDMPGRIAHACRRMGQEPPADQAAKVRCILDSLALAHRRAIVEPRSCPGGTWTPFTSSEAVPGTRCCASSRRTRAACRSSPGRWRPPPWAMCSCRRALGAAPVDLGGMRELLRQTQNLRRFEPAHETTRAWDEAARRVRRG